MTRSLLRFACAALLAAWNPGIAAAASVLPADAQVIDPERFAAGDVADAHARAAKALSALQAGDGDAAVAALSKLPPATFELAAADVLAQLQHAARTPAAERLLTWIAQQPVRLYRRHDETRADWFLPVFNLPAQVESLRTLWTMAEQRDAWRVRWEADPAATLAALPDAASDVRLRAVEAVADLAPARFAAVRSEIDSRIEKRAALPADVLVAIAKRAPDRASLDAALPVADAAALLDLVPIAATSLAPADAIAWLDAVAARQPSLASAATLALAALPTADRRLIDLLADPERGASAAAAIARRPDPQRVAWIDDAIAREQRPKALARLLLALRLEGSEEALASERRWRDDARVRGLLPAEALQ